MKTYVALAPGFEIAEATLPIDILRRAGIETVTVSITSDSVVTASNGVKIVADALLADADLSDGDMLFLPGAMAGFFADVYGPDRPLVTVVEPDSADCLYRTAAADDGELHFAGEMNSIMAGLCCGEPCMLAWHVLKECADGFLTIPDAAAAAGMRILGNPLKGDERITSGESGASAFGAFTEIMRRSELADLRNALELDEHSRVLFISTEGDTDRANYRRIVWDGAYTFPIPIA